MKNFVTFCLLFSALSVQASDYSALPAQKRAQVESKLRDFLPRLNEASLAVLQDLFRESKRPLNPKQRLLDLKFDSGDTFSKMLERQASKIPEVSFGFRDGLYLYELIDLTNNGLKLMRLFEDEKNIDPVDYLRALNNEFSIDQDGEEILVSVDGLGFPYCTTAVILTNSDTRIEENCD